MNENKIFCITVMRGQGMRSILMKTAKKKIKNKITFLQATYTMSNFFHLGLLFVVKYDLNTFLPGFVRFTLARIGRLPCNQIGALLTL